MFSKIFIMTLAFSLSSCTSKTETQQEKTPRIFKEVLEIETKASVDSFDLKNKNKIPSPTNLVSNTLLPEFQKELSTEAKTWHKKGQKSLLADTKVEDSDDEIAQKTSADGGLDNTN